MAMVSIITSAQNEEKYLEATIINVLRQTMDRWEWVIVDDGSTDGTWGILSHWAEKDKRLSPLRNDRKDGLSRSLNKAIEVSRGRYIARMDADDLCRPDRLARQSLFLDLNPQVGVVGSFNHVVDEKGRVLETWRFQQTPEEIYYTLHFQNCLCHSSVMLRRDLLEEIGAYREDLTAAQDYDLWLRASRKTALYKIPEALVSWRLRREGVSVARQEEQSRAAKEIALSNLSRLLGEEVPAFFLATVLGRNTPSSEEERKAFFSLLGRVHEEIVDRAPDGVDRKLLHRLCLKRASILEMGLLWRAGGSERCIRLPRLAVAHPRLLPEVRRYLRKATWTLP